MGLRQLRRLSRFFHVVIFLVAVDMVVMGLVNGVFVMNAALREGIRKRDIEALEGVKP